MTRMTVNPKIRSLKWCAEFIKRIIKCKKNHKKKNEEKTRFNEERKFMENPLLNKFSHHIFCLLNTLWKLYAKREENCCFFTSLVAASSFLPNDTTQAKRKVCLGQFYLNYLPSLFPCIPITTIFHWYSTNRTIILLPFAVNFRFQGRRFSYLNNKTVISFSVLVLFQRWPCCDDDEKRKTSEEEREKREHIMLSNVENQGLDWIF